MAKAEFTRQGKYLWSLIKQAKWDHYSKIKNSELKMLNGTRYRRYELYFMKTFKVTHLEALNEGEIRRAIATIKPYADKENARAAEDGMKAMRMAIVKAVVRSGHTLDWLHELMPVWGLGESLRALDTPGLCEVRANVAKALNRVV
jgi:hypothetical protein